MVGVRLRMLRPEKQLVPAAALLNDSIWNTVTISVLSASRHRIQLKLLHVTINVSFFWQFADKSALRWQKPIVDPTFKLKIKSTILALNILYHCYNHLLRKNIKRNLVG